MFDALRTAPLFMMVLKGPYGENDLSSWVPESSLVGMHREAVINDILAGQFEDVCSVIGIDLKAGKSWDATEEIAMEVEDLLPPEGHRSDWENTLGFWCWRKIYKKEPC